ncbi:hypothetical protein [Helicobacter pylori]|uniref:hypothetical protein n=1 Tax=Helicobacter pylori TaxID=210 RepID=UPI0018F24BB4|nr:hypothetical protein [Helicobacter pylori]
MKILFSVFGWWKTSAVIFKKRFFIGGFSGVKKGRMISKYFLYSQENKTLIK